MKVWSKTLTIADLCAAAQQVNDEFPGCDVFLGKSEHRGFGATAERAVVYVGPRTRRIDGVSLRTRYGGRYPNSGTRGEGSHSPGREWESETAASWTEWGWFIARVFERDPNARVGQYRSRLDFDEQTNGRFIEPRNARERQIKRYLHAA